MQQAAADGARAAATELGITGEVTHEMVARGAAAAAARVAVGMEPNRSGPPPIVVDEEILKGLAAIQCTMEEMSAVLGCSVDTLERRYADVIRKAKEQGKSSLRRKQYQVALSGNPTMLIWMGKNVLGQTDKVAQEVTGAGGGPIQIQDARVVLMAKLKTIAERRVQVTAQLSSGE